MPLPWVALLGVMVLAHGLGMEAQVHAYVSNPGSVVMQQHEPAADVAGLDAAAPAGQGVHSAFARLGDLPLSFVVHCSAGAPASGFDAKGLGYHIRLAPDGAHVGLLRNPDIAAEPRRSLSPAIDVARIRFVGADNTVAGVGTDALPGAIHYFRAGGQRCTDRVGYGRVVFPGIYPGIDVVYYGTGTELEFDFVIGAGADPARIRLAVDGADRTWIDAQGDLNIAIGDEVLVLRHPVAYQQRGTTREPVATRFVGGEGNETSLQVIAYDATRPLTIDPVLSYATYLGGGKTDYATALAVDASGNTYIAGFTTSTDFPLLSAYDKTLASNDVDAFVTKLNNTGKALVYSTYLGGSTGIDRATGIAIDAAGNAYVTGTTTGGFPTTAGAWQTAGTGADSFVVKLGPAGNTLLYSTLLQGVEARGIAVDAAGSAHVAGRVVTTLATTPGAYQRTPGGAFVIKLDPTGTAANYATYLGGGGAESANGIAVDASGNAYVVGATDSAAFPVVNAMQARKAGGSDGFIVKLQPGGSALAYASYLGGALDDTINAVGVDTDGNAYVAGETYSADFPVANAYLAQKPGSRLANSAQGSAFFAKVNPAGDGLVYSSFLGGEVCASVCSLANPPAQTPGDAAYGISVDAQGHAHVTGLARSYTFPLVNSSRPAKVKDNQDSAFVAKVSRGGGALLYSVFTRTGTAGAAGAGTRVPSGAATGVATDAADAAYVVGDADSLSDFKASTGALQTTNGGGQGAVALKWAASAGALALAVSDTAVVAPASITLTATVTGATLSGNVLFMDGPVTIGSVPVKSAKAVLGTSLGVGLHRLSAVYLGAGSEIDSAVVNVIVDNALVCN